MTAPVRLDVFSDYLCPWCYNAAVRLREIQRIIFRTNNDLLRAHPLERLGDIGVERRVTTLVRTNSDAIYPGFSTVIDRTEMKDTLVRSLRLLWEGEDRKTGEARR